MEVGVRRLCGWWCEKREGERGGLALGQAGPGWGGGFDWWSVVGADDGGSAVLGRVNDQSVCCCR